MSSDKKYRTLEDLQKNALYWRKRQTAARASAWRNMFWWGDECAAREKARAFEAEIARRQVPA
ncbi:MAG: hypothetical protein EOS07_22180 [Mesorhizobium sp.]|uniref:hypothetical protein n=1 Tax=Mesorhizobium sp. TaxID=1871066 RepID=UPI000FE4C476|nr:hypothetical protein [Mesorhizobium sp.]RWO06349.1 MAG: hypothetical protein EOS07_22180 [Mesorhizobium sp.]RWP69507.1 MAG: hypothetical protein EOR07_03000 [Mesorhizobium sp.]